MTIDEKCLELPNWAKYATNQFDYYSDTDIHELICRYKLMQIYQNFCLARMQLYYSDERTSYGDLGNSKTNKEIMQKIFIQNAFIYYNFCIDLSWILVYFYVLPTKNDYNITTQEVVDAEKSVNYDFLMKYLEIQHKTAIVEYKNRIEELLEIVKNFWTSTLNEEFRQIYNYTKHQGAYDILGINSQNFFSFKGFKTNIDIIKSKELDIERMTKMLIKFNNDFIRYIDDIISRIIKPLDNNKKYKLDKIIYNICNNSKNI